MVLNTRNWCRRLYGQPWRELRRQVLARDGYKCVACGEPITERTSHIHHRLPLSEGGTNHLDNLESRCKGDHKDKHPFMKYVL